MRDAGMTVVNVSFAAAGFLGIYHLGVIEGVLRHGDKLLCSLKACAGASAGALAATVMITAPDKLQHCKDFTYRFARDVRSQSFGAVTPGYDFMLELRRGIEEILPPDAHQLANERLHISVTNSKTRKNCTVSSFSSKEDLVQVFKPAGALGQLFCAHLCWSEASGVPRAGNSLMQPVLLALTPSLHSEWFIVFGSENCFVLFRWLDGYLKLQNLRAWQSHIGHID
ncbi:patatin-like phospholipase domain-containing protein 4 isoform X3 [Triplophysa dalaica]|uniref:patatin-like phospholipase domain-containing protein 4 isoform X3 n=1 Tax=Triplophysa dalaica TaxID=1582913 RepID=UPI0024DF9EA0|nr:patatin-like phospholipase domain-containing protein 4 isoform X3 [Triplophysa dalaica]